MFWSVPSAHVWTRPGATCVNACVVPGIAVGTTAVTPLPAVSESAFTPQQRIDWSVATPQKRPGLVGLAASDWKCSKLALGVGAGLFTSELSPTLGSSPQHFTSPPISSAQVANAP